MYIFNPEHDLCLANGDPHFVPPESALAFGRDCADLTRWMVGLDDEADSIPVRKILPWGWNYVLRKRLSREGFPQEFLPADEEIEAIAELSDRRFALEALESVFSHCGGSRLGTVTPPSYRIAASSLEQIEGFIAKHRNIVLKAPVSGSGKGIRWATDALSHSDEGWCRNLIARHGCVVAERRLTLKKEFAMLFKATAKDILFCGYSLFYTENGAYRGNILASDEFIRRQLVELVPPELLESVKVELMGYLKSRVCGRYEGFIGVDQFFSEESGFNPVVEINMRMTMGLLARNIYDRFAGELSLGDGTHKFEIIRSKGDQRVNYFYKIYPC